MSATILVTGASGQLGRRVVDHLLDRSGTTIVAGTRDPARLTDRHDRHVEVRRVDFDDPSSLPSALRGVDRVLLISTDALDRPGARVAQHRRMIDAAAASGVSHLVYTSMPRPEESTVLFAPDHVASERAVRESGVPFTILRVSWYQENLSRQLPSILATGRWFTSAGAGRVPYVAREDVARVAAAVLAAGAPTHATLDVTGEHGWSTDEIAALLGRVHGRRIEVEHLDDETLRAGLIRAGLPAPLAELQVSLDRNTRLDRLAPPTDTVERLTGAKPRRLEAFLEEVDAAVRG